MQRNHIIAGVIFLVLVLALFALSPRNTQIIQARFLGTISPLLRGGSSLQRQVSGLTQGMKKLNELDAENRRLIVENNALKANNQLLNGYATENNRLRRALDYRGHSAFKLMPARIIARDSSTWWSTIKVDKGSVDGITPDMPVLTEDGLVGKTTVVAPNAATILLISDENCKVACSVEGTREQGIVRGARTSTTSSPDLALNFLSKMADLKPGQKVYSSGVGGVFPSGVMVGVVRKFDVLPLEGYATIVPSVDLTTIEDVFIVQGSAK